jgi:multicomponent Na+:H+ antiporter subunit G
VFPQTPSFVAALDALQPLVVVLDGPQPVAALDALQSFVAAFDGVRPLLVVALVVFGCFFLTVGTVGLLRFPNVYNRMHATSKPSTLGTAAIFLAGFVHFGPGGAGMRSLIGIVFLFLTVPTGAHMISRAAQRIGVPFLKGVTWPTEDEDPMEKEP